MFSTPFSWTVIADHKKYIHNSGRLSVFVLETGPGLNDHGGWITSRFSGWPSLRISLEVSGWADGAVALATGIACVGAGYAVGTVGSAALGAVSENEKILGKTLIYVGLAEGVAIYGLIISIMIIASL